MNDTRTVLVRYDDNRWEKYPADKAEYWIRRRLEKEGLAPAAAWFAEPFDFGPIVSRHLADQMAYEAELREQREKAEYERLRKKYGEGGT